MRTEDGYIIGKCLNGEREAFGFLVDKYKESIYGFAYSKLLNFQDAEDITQEVFIKAFQKLNTLRRWESFLAWLYSITSNLCKEWIRKKASNPDYEPIENIDQRMMDTSHNEDNPVYDLLNEALGSLPEMYRQVLSLYYLSGMNHKEIADFIGASPMNVLQRLHRAREQLREEMIGMMTATFREQKLSGGFTFRIIELVKRVKIQPISTTKGLPWGLSLGAGLIFMVLMLGQHIQINLSDIAMGLPLPSDTKILEVGEIPVEAVEVSMMASIASKGDGNGLAPDPKGQENAFFMAPQAEGGKWENRKPIPTPRLQLRVEKAENRIFAIGGSQNPSGKNLATNEEYDPVKDKWIKRADMPIAVEEFASAVVDGKIYVIAGVTDNVVPVPTTFEYDPISDTWAEKADFPDLVTYINAAVVDGKIYVFGGEVPPNWEIHKTVYEYDPVIDKWRQMGNMPVAFSSYGCCSFNKKIYLFGGWNGPALSTVWEFDPKADTWSKKKDMPTARWCFHAIPIGNKIYAVGGTNGETLNVLEIYDPKTDTWSKGTDIPTKRSYYGACEWGGLLFVIGGTTKWNVNDLNNPQITDSVEAYTPDTIKSIDPSGKLPQTWGTLKAK